MDKSVSIIIPAWNEEKIILRTCTFLQKLQLPFAYSELVFIAGGNDNTYNICIEIKLKNFNKIKIIKQNPGDFKSGALIKGIKEAKGNIIILIDADTLVAPNLVIEIVKSLKKFDAVNCDYLPLIKKGFWYDFCIIDKLYWARNPNNLSSLYGGATISLKREIINEIGIENFFTNKSRAGVDHYIGMVLKKHNKSLGFVKNTRVITPRPGNIKDFSKDRYRWLTAFFQLHQENYWVISSNLILTILFCLFPPLIFLFNFRKITHLSEQRYPKFKSLIILFFVEYLISILRIKAIIERLTYRQKYIGHFKGSRY